MAFRSFATYFRDITLKTFQSHSASNVSNSICPFGKSQTGRSACDSLSGMPFRDSPLKKRLRCLLYKFNDRLTMLSVLFAKQCNAIAVQRIRRAAQIALHYKNLGYDRQFVKSVVEKLGEGFSWRTKDKSLCFLFGAVLFSWDKEQIREQEMDSAAEEIIRMPKHVREMKLTNEDSAHSWEKLIDKDHLVVWRKAVPNSYLYEYKVCGTYTDIPARAFYDAQIDLEFRKQWDKLVIKLDSVDQDEKSDCQVIQWIMHYPYPMYSREYVYVRKCVVDHERQTMAILSRSTDHPSCPLNENKYVRVNTYVSQMVIRPHSSFDENGFDYILTYYDDPKAAFPSMAYNWMASTGVPDFVDKMHRAALVLYETKRNTNKSTEYAQSSTEQIPM